MSDTSPSAPGDPDEQPSKVYRASLKKAGIYALLLAVVVVGCRDSPGLGATTSGGGPADVEIPTASEFSDAGLVVAEGGTGAWDLRLSTGYSPGLVVEMGGTQYLYYIGADGDRASDGGPNQRRLGVATSTDWTNWTKHASNPHVEYSPNSCPANDDEEGFFSLAGGVYDGTLYLFGGAMIDPGCNGSVDADAHLWTSTDGINFVDQGQSFAGSGGENYPIAAWRDDSGIWHVYYIADTRGGNGELGYATGSDPAALTDQGVIKSGNNWSGGGAAFKKSDTEIVVAVMGVIATDDFEIYTPLQSIPGTLGAADETWNVANVQNGTIYLDRENNLWRWFHGVDDSSEIRQLTAPVRYR